MDKHGPRICIRDVDFDQISIVEVDLKGLSPWACHCHVFCPQLVHINLQWDHWVPQLIEISMHGIFYGHYTKLFGVCQKRKTAARKLVSVSRPFTSSFSDFGRKVPTFIYRTPPVAVSDFTEYIHLFLKCFVVWLIKKYIFNWVSDEQKTWTY